MARVVLPVENELDTPPPPSGVTFTDSEAERWADLWTSGASTQWDGWADSDAVAMLCKLLTKVYDGSASTAQLAEVRHLRDALGLSAAARLRLGWEQS